MSPARTAAFILLTALLLALAACATSGSRDPGEQAQAPAPGGPTGRIEGSVSDIDGSPIAGCRITVTHSGRKWTATADDDGRFILVDLPALDGYKVTLSTPPFWTTTYRNISVTAGQPSKLDVVRRMTQRGGPMTAPPPVR